MYLHRLIFLFTLLISVQYIAAQQNGAKPGLKISGEVTKPFTLSADEFAKMKHSSANMVEHDGSSHAFTGVLIQDILELAGVTTGKQLRGKNLSKYLLVKCADGYQVVFALAELDSGFTDRKIMLADASEGKPLPAGKGPYRVIVPGEKRPARSCLQVTEFVIGIAKE